MEMLRFRVAKSFFSYKRTSEMCCQKLNPELDGSEAANADREIVLCNLICAESVVGPWWRGGSVCALSSVVMENSSPSPPSSEMQHSTVRQASASLFLLSCESLLAFLPAQFPPHSWLDHKEGWALKNWCFRIVVLEKTFESPLDSKEIKPVNPKGNQP